MTLKVGINGFGRIGRMALRSIIENNRKDIQVVAINNRGSAEISSFLLKHDTIHGKLKAKINHSEKLIEINGKKISLIRETEISKINWKKYGVDVVLECTGKFNTKEKSAQHIKSGAKKVLVSAPCKGATNIVFGVNEKTLKNSDQVISAASCTTNCLAPVAKVINEKFIINAGFMTTVHSFTSDQKILDSIHSDLRRARTAGSSMIPTSTGAAKAVGLVLPELNGKLDGTAVRIPTPNVSMIDFTFQSQKKLSIDSINNVIYESSLNEFKNIIEYNTEPLVSIDFNHNPASSIFDATQTQVVGDNFGRILAWYDNEWGFSNRMIDVCSRLGNYL